MPTEYFNSDMEIGEYWAYRPRTTGPFHEARVLAIGTKRPPRVRIELVDETWEGDRRWVSPARLEVRWPELEEYKAADDAYVALKNASTASSLEHETAHNVFRLIDEEIAVLSWQGAWGVTHISDMGRLVAFTGVSEAVLRSHPASVQTESSLDVPWPITEQIIIATARRYPEPLFRHIREEELKIQLESVTGWTVPAWASRSGQEYQTTGTEALQRYEERIRPGLDLLRDWMGKDIEAHHRSLVEAQEELSRVGSIALRAIGALRRLRSTQTAGAYLEELQDPVPAGRLSGYGATPIEQEIATQWAPRYRWFEVDDAGEPIPREPDVDWNATNSIDGREAADRLGIDSAALYKLARSGRLPGQKRGRVWRFLPEDVVAYAVTIHKTPKPPNR